MTKKLMGNQTGALSLLLRVGVVVELSTHNNAKSRPPNEILTRAAVGA